MTDLELRNLLDLLGKFITMVQEVEPDDTELLSATHLTYAFANSVLQHSMRPTGNDPTPPTPLRPHAPGDPDSAA